MKHANKSFLSLLILYLSSAFFFSFLSFTETSMEKFIEDQTIQLLFSIFAILMFIFQVIPQFSSKNILPNHFFGATLMLSVARYLIQIQYFSWQSVNIIISRDFFLSLHQCLVIKTQLMIKTNSKIDGNSHINIYSQTLHKGRMTLLTVCSCTQISPSQHTFVLDNFVIQVMVLSSTVFFFVIFKIFVKMIVCIQKTKSQC